VVIRFDDIGDIADDHRCLNLLLIRHIFAEVKNTITIHVWKHYRQA
jgi:hypothetical protein